MENPFITFLPPWVETGLQPAFYDKESGTCLQQTSRMYAKVNELIKSYNDFTRFLLGAFDDFKNETRDTITAFEADVNHDMYLYKQMINETVAHFIDEFNILHDYVHDYFDNLDVQEEINNKLDAMAEDGFFTDIIEAYIQANVPRCFDSVEAMKADVSISAGSYVQTSGYYQPNDGGTALYHVRALEENEEADDKLLISLHDETLVAELIITKPVNIKQIGCEEDISESCNYLIDKDLDIYIPRGEFTASEPIEFKGQYTNFVCDGDITLTEAINLFEITRNNNIIKVNGSVHGVEGSTLVQMGSDTYHVLYNNIYIHRCFDFDKCFYLNPDNTHGVYFNEISFDGISGEYGILIQSGDTGANWVNANTFTGGTINAPYGITTVAGAEQTDHYNGNKFNGISFAGEIEYAISLEKSSYNFFKELRMSEGLVGDYWIILNNSSDNIFENEFTLGLNKISASNISNLNSKNTFIANSIMKADGTYIGYKAELYNNDQFLIPTAELMRPEKAFLDGVTSGTTWVTPEYYYEGITVTVGSYESGAQTLNYTLPDVFNKRGIRRYFLKVSRQNAESTIKITDIDGSVLNVPSGYINNNYYEVRMVGSGDGNYYSWKMTQL